MTGVVPKTSAKAGPRCPTSDCGGSKGARVRLWKRGLQPFADEAGLTLEVCDDPPGSSEWNAVGHRLFY